MDTTRKRRRAQAWGHAVAVGAVLAIPLTHAVVFILAQGTSWVGGSTIPSSVAVLSMVIPVALGIAGLVTIVLGVKNRAVFAVVEGLLALVVTVALWCLSSFQVVMLSII